MSSHQNKRKRSGTATFTPNVGPKAMSWKGKKANSAVVSQVLRQIQGVVEKKVIDTPAATYACDTAGSVTLINGCAQGTDFTNRIGRKSTMKTVQLEGSLIPQDLTVTWTKCRVMIIHDSQPNGALPTIADIFTNATSASFMNLNNRDRFRVIAEINEAMGGVSNTATQAYTGSPSACNIKLFRKIEVETIYDGTTSSIADVQSGSLLLVTLGDSASTNAWNFSGAVRVRFTDQ